MEEYKPNSNLSKEKMPKKVVESVVTSDVKVRKKNGFARFASELIQEDVRSVKSYIFMDVLLPSLKKAISDIVRNGVDMLLYGKTGVSRGSVIGETVSYRSYYKNANVPQRRPTAYFGDFSDLVFINRGEAEAVLEAMFDIMSHYGIVKVADLYELAGKPDLIAHTDNNYGWTDLKFARVERVYDGYVIRLPKIIPLD